MGGGGGVNLVPVYRCPFCPNLPFAADLQLARTCGLGLLQVVAAVRLDGQTAVGVDLPAEDLTMLHPEAAGLTAFRPFPYIPAKRSVERGREHKWD